MAEMISRVPSSSMIQLHLTHFTPSLSVKLVPIHPTMLTDVCSLEGPATSTQQVPQQVQNHGLVLDSVLLVLSCVPLGSAFASLSLMPINCKEDELFGRSVQL